MDNNQVEQSKKEALARGYAFQEMVRSEGWKFVKAYFENKIKAFTTTMLVSEEPITKFEGERQELIGIRKLLGYIENDMKVLEDERKKGTGSPEE